MAVSEPLIIGITVVSVTMPVMAVVMPTMVTTVRIVTEMVSIAEMKAHSW